MELQCLRAFLSSEHPPPQEVPLLLCILKNILRSLLALSISMVLFRILNPVPHTGKTILLFSVNSPRFSTSVVSYLYPEHRVLYPNINIQRRRLYQFLPCPQTHASGHSLQESG